MDFSTNLSPIHHQRVSTPTPRTAMDLYAIIHASKKKILKMKERNSPEPLADPTTPVESPSWPKAIPGSKVPNFRRTPSPLQDQVNINLAGQYQRLNKPPSPSKIDYDQFPTYPDHRVNSLPRLASEKVQSPPVRQVLSPSRDFPSLDRRSFASSPERTSLASDRLGRAQSTSRNDFKQLLLRANWGTAPSGKVSAVERLKNKVSSSPKKKNSWKSDILSSTILEDCDEEDEQTDGKSVKTTSGSRTPTPPLDTIPKSSALVSQQCKAFDQTRSSPTLETAL